MKAFFVRAAVLVVATCILHPTKNAFGGSATFDLGTDFTHSVTVTQLPDENPMSAQNAQDPILGLRIEIHPGSELASNPEAIAAIERAVATWESVFFDSVTIVIDIEFESIGAAAIGDTATRAFDVDYLQLREAMGLDGQVNEEFVANIPDLPNLNAVLPPGFTLESALRASKANLRALGFDMSFDNEFPDASIRVEPNFIPHFDFDPTDGIDEDLLDFEGVIAHEIGHVLGFNSAIVDVDEMLHAGIVEPVRLAPMDLYRLRPGDGFADFEGAPRIGAPGDYEPNQVLFNGNSEWEMSTGRYFGDIFRADHWRSVGFTGARIGLMDPTLTTGQRVELHEADIRALGLVGWDLIRDCNSNGVHDPEDIAAGTSDDCDANGVPDDCQADCNQNSTADACELDGNDCNENNVPDDCDIADATSPDVNSNGVPDECDCFHNGTCIDSNVCTFDRCIDSVCHNDAVLYGDIAGEQGCGPDGIVDIRDIFASIETFAGRVSQDCVPGNLDLAGAEMVCLPDGILDINDIFAVIDAFRSIDNCCGQ